MSDPIPITKALSKAIASTPTPFSQNAADANPAAIDRKRARELEMSDRQSYRKMCRHLGLDELRELDDHKLADDVLARVAKAVAIDVGLRILGGEFEIKDGAQATRIVRDMHEILRLQQGQPTDIHSTVTMDDVMREMQAFKSRVQGRIAETTAAET